MAADDGGVAAGGGNGLAIPEPVADEFAADEDTPTSGNLLTNDSDPDGDAISVIASDAASASGAAVTVTTSGIFTYDPSAAAALQALAVGQAVADSFTYTISDGNGGTDSATVTVTVSGLDETAPPPLPPLPPPSGTPPVVASDGGTWAPTLDLASLDGSTGFRLDGGAEQDRAGRAVGHAGDINGDGIADILIGAHMADPNGSASGSVYVVYGRAGHGPATVALGSLDGLSGFQLSGAAAGDEAAMAVSGAGDVNGDGLEDLLVGAWRADPNGNQSGAAYVVFGRAGGMPANLDLGALDGADGFALNGAAADDTLGEAVAAAGDVNGDGFADVIVGAQRSDAAGSNAGSAYVVFGAAGGFAASLEASALDGTNGFRLDGAQGNERAGKTVAGAGDVNGDGVDDLIVGTGGGDAYLVFGRPGGFGAALDLGALGASEGVRIAGSSLGATAAGDVNGDGLADLLTGNAVIFGRATGLPATIDVAALDGTTGFRLTGADGGAVAYAAAGDVNGDGFDDLLIGASNADPNGPSSGAAYVVFGRAGGFGAALDLAQLDGQDGYRIDGAAEADHFGRAVSGTGDVNADGLDDILVGALGADPNGSRSGSSSVIFGENYEATDDRAVVIGNVLVNDSDPDGDALAVVGVDAISALGAAVAIRANGSFVYDPAGSTAIQALDSHQTASDSFGYTVSDGNGNRQTASVSVAVTAANAAPDAVDDGGSGSGGAGALAIPVPGDDAFATDEDTPTSGNVLANDSDPDGDPVSVVGFDATSGQGAAVSVAADGNFTYNPATSVPLQGLEAGETLGDAFTYTITDGQGGTDFATVTITVSGVGGNEAPVLGADTGATVKDTALAGNLLANDTDPNGDPLTVISSDLNSSMSVPVSVAADGSFTYNPNGVGTFANLLQGQTASDSFAYTVSDGNGATASAIMTVTVQGSGTNANPIGNGESFTTDENTIITGNVLLNDSDPDGDPLSVTPFSGTGFNGGAVTMNSDGNFTYDPTGVTRFQLMSDNDHGSDEFSYTLLDGRGGSAVVNVDIQVFGVTDAEDNPVVTEGLDLAALDGTDGFKIYGESVRGGPIHASARLGAGDINGDGIADIVLTAPYNGSPRDGAAYVVYGGPGGVPLVSLDDVANGVGGFKIAAGSVDQLGAGLATGVDINGDGIDDIVVGADGNAVSNPVGGAGYVVFGKVGGLPSFSVDDLGSSVGGFTISGAADGGLAGVALTAGDFDGDGDTDIIVGAPDNRGDINQQGTGALFFIEGQAGWSTGDVSLAAIAANEGGFKISGREANDHVGYNIENLGDLNADGIDDFSFRVGGDSLFENAVYVVFGAASGLENTSLDNLDAGIGGFRIRDDDQGQLVTGRVGDINADGIDDFGIGFDFDDSRGEYSGVSYVVFGQVNLASFDLKDIGVSVGGFKVLAEAAGDLLGRSVAGAGDINNDGIDDLLVGAKGNDGGGLYSGAAYVIFGGVALPTTVDLNVIKTGLGGFRMVGEFAGDGVGTDLFGPGDVNNDGIDDVLVGSWDFDVSNEGHDQGSAYVVYGSNSLGGPLGNAAPDAVDDGGSGSGGAGALAIPVPGDDAFATDEDTPTSGNVLANDSDPDGDPVSVVGFDATSGQGAAVSVAADGNFTYNPATSVPLQGLEAGETLGDAFTYTITDGQGGTDFATVTITVSGVGGNEAPVLGADTGATVKDTALAGNLLANDTDPNGDPLTVISSDLNSSMSVPVSVAADGSFTYNPNGVGTFANLLQGQTASDSFAYTVSDGNGATASAIMTVTVQGSGTNANPIGNGESFTTDENTIITGNVLLNDSDPDGDPLSVIPQNGTVLGGGTVVLNSDGSFTYDPTGNLNFQLMSNDDQGAADLEYVINDGRGGTAFATAFITVQGVTDAEDSPVVTDSIDLAALDGTDGFKIYGQTGSGNVIRAGYKLGAGDFNADGIADVVLTAPFGGNSSPGGVYVVYGGPAGAPLVSLDDVANGIGGFRFLGADFDEIGRALATGVDINADGIDDIVVGADGLDHYPDVGGAAYVVFGKAGGLPSFSVDDLGGSVGGFTISGVAEGGAVGEFLAAGDFDGDGDTDILVSAPNNWGDVNLRNAGALFFIEGQAGGLSLDVDLADIAAGQGGFRLSGTLFDEGFGHLVSNLGDIDGDGIEDLSFRVGEKAVFPHATYVVFGKTSGLDATTTTDLDANIGGFRIGGDSGHGVVTGGVGDINGDGIDDLGVGFLHDDTSGDFAGAVYVVYGGSGLSGFDLNDIGVTVAGFKILAEAAEDSLGYALAGAGDVNNDGIGDLVVGVERNDGGGFNSGAAYVVFGGAALPSVIDLDVVKTGQGGFRMAGEFARDLTGSSVFGPGDVNGDGIDDVFTGSIEFDTGGGGSDQGSAYVVYGSNTLGGPLVSQAPVAGDDTGATNENTALAGNLIANDSDPDGDAITLTAFDAVSALGAAVVVGTDGSFTYDPTGSATLQALAASATVADTFTYTISDLAGLTDTATVTITVTGVSDTPVNGLPTAGDDAFATDEGTVLAGSIVANDSDPDNDPISVSAFDALSVQGAGVSVAADGAFTFNPAVSSSIQALTVGQTIADSFTYTITDNRGGTDTATVSVTVTGVNDAPLAVDDTGATNENTALAGNLLTNDSDPDADAITLTAFDALSAKGAAVSVSTDGAFTYDPTFSAALQALAASATTTDTFTYTISDPTGLTDTATVTITVIGVSDTLVNGIPTAGDDAFVTDEGTILVGSVLANDSDPDNDPISVSAFDALSVQGAGVSVAADGAFTFNPAVSSSIQALTVGQTIADSFTYTITDNRGGTDMATVSVTVTGLVDSNVTLTGTSGNDTLDGLGGHDRLFGGNGDDLLRGGDGRDQLFGEFGADILLGGDGNDRLSGGAGNDILDGGAGNDDVASYSADAVRGVVVNLATGVATDQIDGTDSLIGIERVIGTTFADHFTGDENDNQFQGNGGGDTAFGGSGNDTLGSFGTGDAFLDGGAGDDGLQSGSGNDTLIGGDGNDRFNSNPGDDTLDGGAGNDSFSPGEGSDVIDGGAGIDTVDFGNGTNGEGVTLDLVAGTATTSTDTNQLTSIENVRGTHFADVMTGDGGDNELHGLRSDDVIVGGAGDDLIHFDTEDVTSVDGGVGTDTLRANDANVRNEDLDIDLTQIADSVFTNFETVDLTADGPNNLTLSLGDLLAITDSSNTLTVTGNANDTVATADSGWASQGTVDVGGVFFDSYANGLATLLVDQAIDQTGILA